MNKLILFKLFGTANELNNLREINNYYISERIRIALPELRKYIRIVK